MSGTDVIPSIESRCELAAKDERMSTGALYKEAAGEITRLRAEEAKQAELADHWRGRAADFATENARLRAELQQAQAELATLKPLPPGAMSTHDGKREAWAEVRRVKRELAQVKDDLGVSQIAREHLRAELAMAQDRLRLAESVITLWQNRNASIGDSDENLHELTLRMREWRAGR